MEKLAIALQVWNGDVFLGMKLLRLICSIEPKMRDDIEFVLSARRGTNEVTVREMRSVAQTKFANVRVINCKRFGVGWPHGCNDLWAETMMRMAQMKEAGKIESDGVLTFEADCVPMCSDWLNLLRDEWTTAQFEGMECIGHAHGEPPNHINGNAIFACNIQDKHPELNGCDAITGWDYHYGKLMLAIGRDTNLIHQLYNTKQMSLAQFKAIRKNGELPALVHGFKDIGIALVQAMMKDGSFLPHP